MWDIIEKALKKYVLFEVMEDMMTILYEIDSINKEIEKNQMKILVLKNTTTEMKNSLEGLNSKFYLSEGRMIKLEGRLFWKTKRKKNEEKWKKNLHRKVGFC